MRYKIDIAQRYRPFTHKPGAHCLIPASMWSVEVFPASFTVWEQGTHPIERCCTIHMEEWQGVEEFTVQQDLEQERVLVWGRHSGGYFRYALFREENQLKMTLLRGESISYTLHLEGSSSSFVAEPKSSFVLIDRAIPFVPSIATERLALGVNKKQDWALMRRRNKMQELFPLWFMQGRSIPLKEGSHELKRLAPVVEALQSVLQGPSEEIIPLFSRVYQQHFNDEGLPSLEDREKRQDLPLGQGIGEKETALLLLTEGARLIRSCLLRWEGASLYLLPKLPPELFCGRYLHFQTSFGSVDLEWTKKAPRRAVLKVHTAASIQVVLPAAFSSFRVTQRGDKKKVICHSGDSLALDADCTYELDRFEK